MKPVCAPCQRFFRPFKTGYAFIEGMPKKNGALPGLAEPENWKPYKLWNGDIWRCEGCGAKIIVGTGINAIAQNYEKDFEEKVRQYGANLQVNDC